MSMDTRMGGMGMGEMIMPCAPSTSLRLVPLPRARGRIAERFETVGGRHV